MLTLHTAHLGQPSLIPGTDLRVTYAGADKPSLVERVEGDVVWQAYVVAPNLPILLPCPFGMSWQEWTVTFQPQTLPDRALVHVIVGDATMEPRW